MNLHENLNSGNWLKQFNGKTVENIYQVDFNHDRDEDIYLPWLFFITFSDYDRLIEIEGDIDGEHLRIKHYDHSELDKKLKENNLADQPYLWRVYETKKDEILGLLLGKKIKYTAYGIDKDEFEINGTRIKGQKDVFNFVSFVCESLNLTIFEGSATGLQVSDDQNVKLNFEATFDQYDTQH